MRNDIFSSFVKPNNTLEEKTGCYLKVMWFYVMIKYEKFKYGHEIHFLFLKQSIFFFSLSLIRDNVILFFKMLKYFYIFSSNKCKHHTNFANINF